MKFRTVAIAVLAAAGLAGCKTAGDLVVEEGVGITALRTVCPAVGIPDHTGDVTLFSPAGAVTADALDLTATITNVRTTCDDTSDRVYAQANFDVYAQRRDTRGARTVELPYFSTVVRGGSAVVAKRIGTVTLNFADGEARAAGTGSGGAFIDRRLDFTGLPLAEPEVRAALARATFELLVGFQLTQDQLAYNVTR